MAKTTTIFCGNNFVNVDFPDHTRILKAPVHDDFLEDPRKAVVDAVRNPLGMKPLKELVKAGSRVMIAFDDLAVPVPPVYPSIDNRQIAIEAIIDELYAAGVRKKDIVLVCANGLHRMWKRSEIAMILGNRIMKEFSLGQIVGHDGEDPENLLHLGLTENGLDVEVNRLLVEADQAIYVNVNWVPFNGGWKSTMIGLGHVPGDPAHPQQRDLRGRGAGVVHGTAPEHAPLENPRDGPSFLPVHGVPGQEGVPGGDHDQQHGARKDVQRLRRRRRSGA